MRETNWLEPLPGPQLENLGVFESLPRRGVHLHGEVVVGLESLGCVGWDIRRSRIRALLLAMPEEAN